MPEITTGVGGRGTKTSIKSKPAADPESTSVVIRRTKNGRVVEEMSFDDLGKAGGFITERLSGKEAVAAEPKIKVTRV